MCDSWDTSSGAAGNHGSGGGGGNNSSSSGGGGSAGDRSCDLSRKWVCKACTYENWPRASKCAICCHPKNYNIFLDPHRPHDIYEIASLFGSAHSQSASVYNPKNKWSCASCTYLNWPKANKCTQCQRRRSSSPPFGPTSGHHEHNVRSPKLKSKDQQHHASSGPRSENHTFPLIPSWTPPDLRSSRPTHRASEENNGSDYYYNDRNRVGLESQPRRTSFTSTRSPPPTASATATTNALVAPAPAALVLPSNVQKWSCSVCTYENWPRASRCNMCQTLRRTPSFSRTTGEHTSVTDSLSLMKLTSAAAADLSLEDQNNSSLAEAAGGLVASEHNLSGFSSDSDPEDEGGDHVLAFKPRKRRE